MQGKSFVHMAWQACQQENDLIVMSTGDMENSSFFIATPDVDVAALRQEWCRRYCKANNTHRNAVKKQRAARLYKGKIVWACRPE